jgi:hypothetical protein
VSRRPTLSFKQWNEKLLRHYFAAPMEAPQYHRPVEHLVVSDEELLAASGRVFDSPEAARDDLVAVFRDALRDGTFQTVFQPAERSERWEPPEGVVALVASCIVAAEYASEENYVAKLNELCGNDRSNSTVRLPDLWEELGEWIAVRRTEKEPDRAFRALWLPHRPEAGWRNIFYSLAMTFPSRRDREHLANVLAPLSAEGIQPTVSEVLSAVEARQKLFSDAFSYQLDDFRRSGKAHHPFWHAVQDVWFARSTTSDAANGARILACVVDGVCHPFLLVATEEQATSWGLQAVEFPGVDSASPWAIADELGELEPVVARLLAGELRLDGIDDVVQRGVLLFQYRTGFYLEWCRAVPADGRGIALVRFDVRSDLERRLRQISGSMGNVVPSQFDGWLFVSDVEFGRRGPALSLELKTAIDVAEGTGVRVGQGGFLGVGALLPRFLAPAASHVVAERRPGSRNEVVTLVVDAADGSWRFPSQDLYGQWLVVGRGEDAPDMVCEVFFQGVPAHTEFKKPSQAQIERLLVEGSTRDVDDLLLELNSWPPQDRAPTEREEIVYLGPAVGDWVRGRSPGYDWRADTREGLLTFVGDPESPTEPTHTVLGKSAARFWKKCFADYTFAGTSSGVKGVYSRYRALLTARGLPRERVDKGRPVFEEIQLPPIVPAHPGVDLFSACLAASATRASGLAETEVFRLMELAFGTDMDWALRWDVLRAWVEAGVLEACFDARWPTRRYFVRRPRLVLNSEAQEAVLFGLLPPAARTRLEVVAASDGRPGADRGSLSPWAPRLPVFQVTPTLRAEIERLGGFAPAEYLPAPEDWSAPVDRLDSLGRDDPPTPGEHRIWNWRTSVFEFAPTRTDGEVMVRLVSEERRPDRYEVVKNGRVVFASFSRVWAILAAADRRGVMPFAVTGALVCRPHRAGAQLPTSIARALAVMGPTSGPIGPVHNHKYAYWFIRASMAKETLSRLLPGAHRKE